MTNPIILGIDPGLSGAIAMISGEQALRVWDMPVTEKTHGKGLEVNPYLLADLFAEALAISRGTCCAYVEQVSAMPGQGVSSMFSFGQSAGVISGCLGALGIRHTKVTPATWKRAHGLVRKDKDTARTLAIRLYPEMADRLTRKKDVGRADALLIAAYGQQW